MRAVKLNCTVVLEDDTAEWLEKMIKSDAFPPELAFYFEQRSKGGYVVTQDTLDEIIDEVLDEDDTSATVEEAVKKALTEMIESGVFVMPQNNTSNSISSDVNTKKVEEDNKPEPEESGEVVSFAAESESDGEVSEMSNDELDDLADMFGF